MSLETLLARFAAAVEAGDGAALAACFAADGVYHDSFYGAFEGREAIRDMLEGHFWRDGEAFRWDFEHVLEAGGLGYASWLFSYTSRLPEAAGKRVVFEGMARFTLRDGLIQRYDELFDTGAALAQLDFAPERIARHTARRARTCQARAAGTRHERT